MYNYTHAQDIPALKQQLHRWRVPEEAVGRGDDTVAVVVIVIVSSSNGNGNSNRNLW